ncbi:YlbF family regulator [Paenibacillus sp. CC-CFT747]|nr:YlbF family regulator [Paenibacillus sp. CC-CFT747]
MNIHDKAHELARAVKESPEYKDMLSLRSEIDAEPEAKRMLSEFREKNMELQQRMMAGDMPGQEDMERMEKLFQVLNLNPSIGRLFEAERRLSVVMEDVQKIITEPFEAVFR